MHYYVVRRVERAGVVVIQQRRCLVRAFGFHVYEAGRFLEAALGADDEPVSVVGAAVGHVIALRAADLITGKVCRGKELDFCNDDCFITGGDGVWRGVFQLVRSHKERVCRWVKDASFVEIGSAIVFN